MSRTKESRMFRYGMMKSRCGGWVVSYRPTARGKSDTLKRKIPSIVRSVEDGAYNPTMKQRMADLETGKQELAETLSMAKEPPVVRLHPRVPDI
jgi:site-specific DNA recombinase